MADLQDILKIINLKRGRLEKDVAELGKRQNLIADKIRALEADKLRISSNLYAQSEESLSVNENIVFELWCHGMVQKKNKLTKQKMDIDTTLEDLKAKLKAIFVQEDIILTRLQHRDRVEEAMRIETRSSSRLELWVNTR